jgi:hypothetical protein
VIGIQTDHGIKERLRKWQRMGLSPDGKDPVGHPGCTDACPVVAGRNPKIGGPDLDAKFLGQKDRAECTSATKIQDPHAGTERRGVTQGLREPQHIGSHLVVEHPLRIVRCRPRELVDAQSFCQLSLRVFHRLPLHHNVDCHSLYAAQR